MTLQKIVREMRVAEAASRIAPNFGALKYLRYSIDSPVLKTYRGGPNARCRKFEYSVQALNSVDLISRSGSPLLAPLEHEIGQFDRIDVHFEDLAPEWQDSG